MRFKFLCAALLVLFSVWTIYSFIFWGRPVPFQVQTLERIDSNGDGVIDTWRLDSSQDGQADITELDTDGDGRIDRLQVSHPKRGSDRCFWPRDAGGPPEAGGVPGWRSL